MNDRPDRPSPLRVTVIIPCRNERDYIASCLDSVLGSDYPSGNMEILVVDGMSEDGTREIVQLYERAHPSVMLIDNERRITPVAMNLGVTRSTGGAVMILSAHTTVANDYVSRLVGWLESSDADAVGGVMKTLPANGTRTANAIAVAQSHPLGVGNSQYRLGTREPRWVDTVVFGCYRREVFERVGLFDEDLVRNQDDEYNMRLARRKGRMLLVPDVESRYFARDSLGKLWRMYYQYGYFKPLVVRKVKGVMTLRQLVPAAFVTALVAACLLAFFARKWAWLALTLALTYCSTLLIAAGLLIRRRGVGTALASLAVFPVLHFAYGLGYLHGSFDFFIRRKSGVGDPKGLPTSR